MVKATNFCSFVSHNEVMMVIELIMAIIIIIIIIIIIYLFTGIGLSPGGSGYYFTCKQNMNGYY